MRPLERLARLTGTLLIVLGVGLLAWTFCVWRWNDPFTSTYTRWQQHKLADVNQQIFAEFRPTVTRARTPTPAQQSRAMARDAAYFRKGVAIGDPIGRLRVPRLGVNLLLINGTDTASLKSGPGRDTRTFMPGQGELVYIAGHRTTYGAPFAHIERLRAGDRVTLEMPYATIEYAVARERIVDDQDLSVLKSAAREEVALQACHPRFWATERYIVWAKPVRATRGDGASFAPVT